MKNILKAFLFSLIVCSFVPACSESDYSGPSNDETGSISFNVEWRGAPTLPEENSTYTRALNCQESKIDTVTFEVLDENDNPLADDSWECIAGEGIVYGVSAGASRKLIVEGKDLQNRVLYRGIVTDIVVTAGEHEDVETVICEPVAIIDYAFLQYRTYEDNVPTYKGWIDFTIGGNLIDMSDITQITLKDPTGTPEYLSGTTFYSDSHYSGSWNDLTSSMDFSGPNYYNGFLINFPVETSLVPGDYTYEATTSQEDLLSITLNFPGETTLPTISNADMNYEWRIDNSLYLSWISPVGDFDDLRIILADQDFRDLLYITLPVDANELTVPSSIIQNITDLKHPNSAKWIVQTRSFTETIDENNYARGYSSFVNIPWQYKNSLGMTFNKIQPSSFTMGSPDGVSEYPIGSGETPAEETGRGSDETPHHVTLTQSFYLQTTEVTQEQWEAVMGSNPSNFTSCGVTCPVESVSWENVQIFLATLNSISEGTYSLPTEAQWEYAARAGSITAYANGGLTEVYCDYSLILDSMGWYCYNAESTTHPVGLKNANAWGLYDMHGNVIEWCQDWYGTYPSGSLTDPTGPTSGSYRIGRGGSWDNLISCRLAARALAPQGASDGTIGFRLLWTP